MASPGMGSLIDYSITVVSPESIYTYAILNGLRKLCLYAYGTIIIKEQEAIKLSESKKRNMGAVGGKKGKGREDLIIF